VGNTAREIRAHTEYGTGTVVSTNGQTTRVDWGPVLGILNHWTNCLQRTVEPVAAPVPAEIVVGSRVRHIGNAARGVDPRPELGVGTVQNMASHDNVRVIWERGGRGELGHYLVCLELVAAQTVQPQPPAATINRFAYGAVDYTAQQVNHINGVLLITATSDAGRDQIFSIIPSEELIQLRQRPAHLPPPERRVLHSRWRCVYRDNRRGAEYETRNAAVEANPRARRVEEITYYNDGTTEAEIGDI
jgi:hypothetical protein